MAGFPQVGDTFGDYAVESVLGHGGMGVVFRARHQRLNRAVALKVLSPVHAGVGEFRDRFIREAGILAAMDSPHIIQVYDHGEHQGCLFIATQLIAGGDLSERLSTRGRLSTADAVEIAGQLATALADAHAAGVVHRDVKPKNVLLRTDDDRPHSYLCDFGIARGDEDQITQTGVVVGTYAYLAPERCQGEDATPASDLYSLGCVLVAMLTGSAPYGGTDMQVAHAHISAPVPQLAGNTAEIAALNQVIVRSMAKNPAERYTSAREMRTALREVQEFGRTAALTTEAERTQVRQRVPDPVAAPPSETTPDATVLRAPPPSSPGPVPPRRSRSRTAALIGVPVISLAAVGTALALTLGTGNGAPTPTSSHRNPSSSTPSASPTQVTTGPVVAARTTPAAARTPVETRVCWDGSRTPITRTCPLPTGYAGMRYVFPSYRAQNAASTCVNQPDDIRHEPGKLLSLACNVSTSAGPVQIVYGTWTSWKTALAHYTGKYQRSGRIEGDLLAWGPRDFGGSRGIQAALLYRSTVPFSVTVKAPSDAAAAAALATVQHTPSATITR